jgi:hypothetical protein
MANPITFSIPKSKICKEIHTKTKFMSDLIPGDTSTYIYDTEKDYYEEYQKSYFAMTKKKAGWDCMRHYEILANGCIPYFVDLEKCPENTMALLPKNILLEGNKLYEEYKNKKLSETFLERYNVLRDKLLKYTRDHLTTDEIASYIIKTISVKEIKKVLYLSGNTHPDYLRCLTLHGFKTLLGSKCHDYPKITHIYKTDDIHYDKLYGKGITYTNLLDPKEMRDDDLDRTLIEDIKNKKYDAIIYGSFHRGMPYYDIVTASYRPDEVTLLCGEDIHRCDNRGFIEKGHNVFVREL